MDVLGTVGTAIITDIREKPRKKGFLNGLFLSQEEM
jgi:hypothetical protein